MRRRGRRLMVGGNVRVGAPRCGDVFLRCGGEVAKWQAGLGDDQAGEMIRAFAQVCRGASANFPGEHGVGSVDEIDVVVGSPGPFHRLGEHAEGADVAPGDATLALALPPGERDVVSGNDDRPTPAQPEP